MAEAYVVKPLSAMRKVIAARMVEATRTIPTFRLTVEIEVDAMLERRNELQGHNPDVKISLNDFLLKACAGALVEEPSINIQWVEGQIHQYRKVDLSVVIAVEGGLTTPIIRSAESKTVLEIALEVQDLAERATRNALKMNEIQGGSFTVSNLGMHGVDQFDAIINPPQCAILALGRARPRWVVTENGGARVATVLTATVSADHRAVDGAIGAAFLTAFRHRVEQPRC